MPRRKFIFKGGGKELVLPVTPESYQVEKGINVEVVNIHQLGDAVSPVTGRLQPSRFPACSRQAATPFRTAPTRTDISDSLKNG